MKPVFNLERFSIVPRVHFEIVKNTFRGDKSDKYVTKRRSYLFCYGREFTISTCDVSSFSFFVIFSVFELFRSHMSHTHHVFTLLKPRMCFALDRQILQIFCERGKSSSHRLMVTDWTFVKILQKLRQVQKQIQAFLTLLASDKGQENSIFLRQRMPKMLFCLKIRVTYQFVIGIKQKSHLFF